MPKRFLLYLLMSFAVGCNSKDESKFGPLPEGSESRDEASPDALAIVKSSLEAHGGDVFRNLKAGQITVFTLGYPAPRSRDEITTVFTFQFPDQLRVSEVHTVTSTDPTVTTRTWHRMYLRDRGHAWKDDGDGVFESTTELRRIEFHYPLRLIDELQMVNDGGLSPNYGGDVEVDGRTLTVIRLTRDGKAVSEVSFDKSTKLIAKISSAAYNPKAGRLGRSETFYSDYRSFSGLMLPARMVTYFDGEKFVEMTLREFKAMDHVDPKEFVPGKSQQGKTTK